MNHGEKSPKTGKWKLSTKKADEYYNPKNFPKEHEMGFHVALGVKRTFPEIPFLYTFYFPKNANGKGTIQIAGKEMDHVIINYFDFFFNHNFFYFVLFFMFFY